MTRKFVVKGILTILLLLTLSIPKNTFAEGEPSHGGDPEVPIDGGLGFLLAAGMAYGARKLLKNKKDIEF